jgi:hypothetical protein
MNVSVRGHMQRRLTFQESVTSACTASTLNTPSHATNSTQPQLRCSSVAQRSSGISFMYEDEIPFLVRMHALIQRTNPP